MEINAGQDHVSQQKNLQLKIGPLLLNSRFLTKVAWWVANPENQIWTLILVYFL